MHITEIVPDLDTMPDWAQAAFLEGQFFRVALARVLELESALQPFADAYVRANHKESWAASYLNNSSWKKAYQAAIGEGS